MFRSWERKSLQRRAGDIWFKGFAAGYRESHHDTMEFFVDQVIREIQEDAVLSMTADLDTLERIVEIMEAVRDDGETPHGKTQN